MSVTLTIDREFESLIAPLTPQEFELLEQQIRTQGCLQPIAVWKTGEQRTILDGHNRFKICTARNVQYQTVNVVVASREHAKLWILEHQAGRRNLTDDQRAIIWNDIREQRSKIASAEGAAKARAAKDAPKVDSVKAAETEPAPKRDTRAEVAREGKVPVSKIRRAQQLKDHQPALYDKVRSGVLKLRDTSKLLRKTPKPKQNSDFFRHLGHLLDGVFKGQLKTKLDEACKMKGSDLSDVQRKGLETAADILEEISEQANQYRDKIKKVCKARVA
jgi:ParB-like chromosome segregation protein Spo0J